MNIGREVNGIKQRLEENGIIGKEIGYKELQGIYDEYGGGMSELDFAKGVLNISYAGYSDLKYGNAKITLLTSPAETNETIRKEKVNKVEKVIKLDSYVVENKSVFENYDIDKMSKSNLDLDVDEKNETYKRYPVDLKPRDDDNPIIENEENIEKNTNDESNEKEEKIYTKEELENICSKNYLTMLKLISFGKNNCDESLLNKYNEEDMWFGKTTMSKDFVNSNWDTIIKITESALNNTKKRYGTNYSKGKSNSDLIQEAAFYLVKNRGDIEKNFKGNDDIVKKLVYLSVSRYINCEAINIVGINNPKVIVNKTYKTKVDNIEENKESYDIGELLAIKKELEDSKKDVIQQKEETVFVEDVPISEIKEVMSDCIKEIPVEEANKKEKIVIEETTINEIKEVASDYIKEIPIEEVDKKEEIIAEETRVNKIEPIPINEIPVDDETKTLVEEIINKENATSMGENLTEPAIDNENVIPKKEVKINYEELIKKQELSKQFGNENLDTNISDIKEELIDENPNENQNNLQEKFGEEKLGMREKTILASMRMYLVSDGKIKISNSHLGKKDGDEN